MEISVNRIYAIEKLSNNLFKTMVKFINPQ